MLKNIRYQGMNQQTKIRTREIVLQVRLWPLHWAGQIRSPAAHQPNTWRDPWVPSQEEALSTTARYDPCHHSNTNKWRQRKRTWIELLQLTHSIEDQLARGLPERAVLWVNAAEGSLRAEMEEKDSFLLFVGHTPKCSGVTPDSTLKNHSWQAQGDCSGSQKTHFSRD